MNTKLKTISAVTPLLFLASLSFLIDGYRPIEHSSNVVQEEQKELVQVKAGVKEEDLKVFIAKSMSIVKPQMSEVKKFVVIDTLARVAEQYLETREHKELWIAMLATESAFNPKAKSPAGAIGIGQVMPGSAEWYGKKCGLEGIEDQDLYDLHVNALVSVCIFKQILEGVGGRSSLLLVAYNAGAYSKDVKRIDELKSINTESANYVAKIFTLMEKTKSLINKEDN